jgi:hypothetical protein
MEGYCFVISVTGHNRSNTGKNYEDNDIVYWPVFCMTDALNLKHLLVYFLYWMSFVYRLVYDWFYIWQASFVAWSWIDGILQ